MTVARIILESEKAKTLRGARAIINKWFRDTDESHLWPVSGKFNVTERAIRRARKFEKDYGVMSPLEYAYWLDFEISRIVNDEGRI